MRSDGTERYFVAETGPARRTMWSTTSSMKWRDMAVTAMREADMRFDGWVEIVPTPVPATRARITGAPWARLTLCLSLRRFGPTPKPFLLRARSRPPARGCHKTETVRCAIGQPIQAAECAARMIPTTWPRASEPFEHCFPGFDQRRQRSTGISRFVHGYDPVPADVRGQERAVMSRNGALLP